jgi:hypothetical protein
MQIANQIKTLDHAPGKRRSSPSSSASGLAAGVLRTDADANKVLTEQGLEDPFKPQG